ncbi:MAG TPA: HAMP domain-containing sensor histidine kinase [Chloroflexota bacterium]
MRFGTLGRVGGFGGRLRGAQFLLDDGAAQHLEAYFNQARLVLIGCLLVLASRGMFPGATAQLILALAAGGLAWFLLVGLLIRHLYRPWVAIAIALVDVAFISTLIYLTGGPLSPLDALYPIVVFAAIIRFTPLHSIMFTVTTIAVFALVEASHPDYLPEVHSQELLTRAVILAATGVLAWLIGAEVARQRRAIAEAQQQLDSLTTISHIARTLGGAHQRGEIVRAAVDLVEPLVGRRGAIGALVGQFGQLHVVAAAGRCHRPGEGVGLETERIAAAAEDQSPEAIIAAMRADGCRDVLEVPIVAGGVTLGWLFVGQPAGAPLMAPDRALVQRLAEEAAAALQRTELLERERERARSLALLADENARLLETERNTVARLRQLATHKDGFIDMVAHELRTPLTSIRGFAQMMSRSATGSADASRYTTFILAESDRLMGIIDDIVDLSRMERGLLEMHWQSIDLTPLLREVAALAYPSGVRAAVELEPGLPSVRGDHDKLRQSFVNLLQTGAKYHRDAAPMTLVAGFDGANIQVHLDVVGPVPSQRLAEVFDHVPDDQEPARSGLGLYICRNFVEAHGGRVWLEHGESRSRFLLQLPAEPKAFAADEQLALPAPDQTRRTTRPDRHGRKLPAHHPRRGGPGGSAGGPGTRGRAG